MQKSRVSVTGGNDEGYLFVLAPRNEVSEQIVDLFSPAVVLDLRIFGVVLDTFASSGQGV
jgi:hypothetical protein